MGRLPTRTLLEKGMFAKEAALALRRKERTNLSRSLRTKALHAGAFAHEVLPFCCNACLLQQPPNLQ
jgi:hypothetical protein